MVFKGLFLLVSSQKGLFLALKRQCFTSQTATFYKPKEIVFNNQKGISDKRLNFSSQKEMFYAAKRQCLTLWPKPAPLVPLPSVHSTCLVREWRVFNDPCTVYTHPPHSGRGGVRGLCVIRLAWVRLFGISRVCLAKILFVAQMVHTIPTF